MPGRRALLDRRHLDGLFYGFAGRIEKMAQVDFELDRPNRKRWDELLSKRPSFA